MKPPKNKYIFGFEYGIADSLKLATPSKGNKANGKRAVTATGIDSVAHQTAINTTIAATVHPLLLSPLGAGKRKIRKKSNNPSQKPFLLYAYILLKASYYSAI